MLLHLIPGLDSESIRMFKDGPLEKSRERGGEFSSRINLFSLLFSLYVFFLRLCINIFWGYLACIKFFPFNFPLVLRPLRLLQYFPPPTPHPASTMTFLMANGPSLKTPRSCTSRLCTLNRMCSKLKHIHYFFIYKRMQFSGLG